jgi:DNA-binding XRE family transcriptional regulator
MPVRPSPDPLSSMWAWIAWDLRFHRQRAGMNGEDFGRIINVVRATVSRMESGEYKIQDAHARALDKHFNTGGHFARLLHFARLGHNPDWHKDHLNIEARSDVIKSYEALVVPGLLQIPEYARALIAAGGEPDVDGLVEERMARQVILTREPPPMLWVLLTQNVLDWPVGGPEVMRAQLARLLEASDQPNIGIRVVPRASGAQAGANGSFKLLSGPAGEFAYTDSPGGGRLVPTVAEVKTFALRYDRIGMHALPEDQSRDMIRQAMEALR